MTPPQTEGGGALVPITSFDTHVLLVCDLLADFGVSGLSRTRMAVMPTLFSTISTSEPTVIFENMADTDTMAILITWMFL